MSCDVILNGCDIRKETVNSPVSMQEHIRIVVTAKGQTKLLEIWLDAEVAWGQGW